MIGIVSYLVFFLTMAFVLSIAVLGLNLQWGYTGLFNGGVAAFFGAGAYGVILFGGSNKAGQLIGFGLPYPFAVAGAVLLAGLLAWIVGLITTHLRHDYLAIATFGVAIFVFVVLIIVYNILENIGQSPFGRLLRAIREDEVAAQSLGKSPARVRLQAFIFGSMIMGLSGALYATFYAFISPQDIVPILTFQIWSMLIVGGSGNNKGAVFGTMIVWAGWVGSGWVLTQFAPVEMQLYIGTIQFIMIGLIIVLTLLIRPKGLLPEKLIISRSVARVKPE